MIGLDTPSLDLDAATIDALTPAIDYGAVRPDHFARVRRLHRLQVEGLDRVASATQAVFVANHCAIPVWSGTMWFSEQTLLTLEAIRRRLAHPLRSLVSHAYYDAPRGARCRRHREQLGFLPATLRNGHAVMALGQSLFLYPEGRGSIPPYRLRDFRWGFAKIAAAAGAAVQPVVMTGPHEAVLRVTHQQGFRFLTGRPRAAVPFRIEFLEPVDASAFVDGPGDERGLTALTAHVRSTMQHALDRETRERARAVLAARLEEQMGDGS